MKPVRILIPLALILTILIPGPAIADEGSGPISLGLFTPIQIVGETKSVDALRLNLIYAKNADLTGIDLGLIGRNTGDVAGVAWNAVGVVDGNFTGWQDSWLASITRGNMQGLQVGAYTASGMGSSGVQLGLINTSDDFSGLQFGLVNVAESMRSGLQIGLVNIIKNKDSLKFFPLVNWKF